MRCYGNPPIIRLLPAMRALLASTIVLLLAAPPWLWAQGSPAPLVKPDAALTPVAAIGDLSEGEKRILYNRLQAALSESYRLVSQEDYAQAEEKAFRELSAANCTEERCIRKIQELLQVERLFALQVVRERTFTQITLTLVRAADKVVREDACDSCSISQLHARVETLVQRLTAADRGTPAPPPSVVAVRPAPTVPPAPPEPAPEPTTSVSKASWPLWTGLVLLAAAGAGYSAYSDGAKQAKAQADDARATHDTALYADAKDKAKQAESTGTAAAVAGGIGAVLMLYYMLSGPSSSTAHLEAPPTPGAPFLLAAEPGGVRMGVQYRW